MITLLTQFLAGYGNFGFYLYRIKKQDHNHVRDDPYHAIFFCMRWEERRTKLRDKLGRYIYPDDVLIDTMLDKETHWNILQIKERED